MPYVNSYGIPAGTHIGLKKRSFSLDTGMIFTRILFHRFSLLLPPIWMCGASPIARRQDMPPRGQKMPACGRVRMPSNSDLLAQTLRFFLPNLPNRPLQFFISRVTPGLITLHLSRKL